MTPIRIVIADDHAVVREGLRLLLAAQPDLEVVGEAADGEQAVAMATQLLPDVVLMDIRMPKLDGIEATRRIAAVDAGQPPRVVVLTTYDLDEYAFDALTAGASGFLLKDVPAGEMIAGVRAAARGDVLLSPAITKRLVAEFAQQRSGATGVASGLNTLTEREREVLVLVARGLSNLEIANRLFVSEGTVKTHVSHLLDKLELRDRVQAVIFAYETGLIQRGEGDV